MILPVVNTEAMNAHLAEIARSVAPGTPAVLVLDGAGWHGARALTVFDTYDGILDACCTAWNFFADDPEAIASITSRS